MYKWLKYKVAAMAALSGLLFAGCVTIPLPFINPLGLLPNLDWETIHRLVDIGSIFD